MTGNETRAVDRSSMSRIPGGRFVMGSDRHYPEERPAHPVTVDDFWIDTRTVATPSSPPSSPRPDTSHSPNARSTPRSTPAPRPSSRCPARWCSA